VPLLSELSWPSSRIQRGPAQHVLDPMLISCFVLQAAQAAPTAADYIESLTTQVSHSQQQLESMEQQFYTLRRSTTTLEEDYNTLLVEKDDLQAVRSVLQVSALFMWLYSTCEAVAGQLTASALRYLCLPC